MYKGIWTREFRIDIKDMHMHAYVSVVIGQ